MDIVFCCLQLSVCVCLYLYILFDKLVGWPASSWFGCHEEEKVRLDGYITYLKLFQVLGYNYISNKMFLTMIMTVVQSILLCFENVSWSPLCYYSGYSFSILLRITGSALVLICLPCWCYV